MSIEIVSSSYRGVPIYSGVDDVSGFTHGPFTQFIIWISLGKSIRKAMTRARRAATLTVREYAFRLKRWFDFIDDWNANADNADKIEWNTAQKKHMDYFLDQLTRGDIAVESPRRNGLRLVWEMFYEDFCPFMGYSHRMFGLTELVEISPRWTSQTGNLQRRGSRKVGNVIRRSLGKDPENESKTFKVLNPEDVSLLLVTFDDAVFSCMSYLMYGTGLRIGGALQVPYKDTDVNNKYITSPLLIVRDYGITDGYFPYSYIPKGHEHLGDRYECDIPIYVWEDIWNIYYPLLEKRLELWRINMIQTSGDASYAKRYPKTFWLNKKGKEVKAFDVWKAFRDARNKIKKDHRSNFPTVVPQMFRHTYATRLVLDFTEKGNVELDPNNRASVEFVHQYLQEQLGHQDRTTTVKYMRTALRVVKRRWIPKVLLSSKDIMPNGKKNATTDHAVNFKGLMGSFFNKST